MLFSSFSWIKMQLKRIIYFLWHEMFYVYIIFHSFFNHILSKKSMRGLAVYFEKTTYSCIHMVINYVISIYSLIIIWPWNISWYHETHIPFTSWTSDVWSTLWWKKNVVALRVRITLLSCYKFCSWSWSWSTVEMRYDALRLIVEKNLTVVKRSTINMIATADLSNNEIMGT